MKSEKNDVRSRFTRDIIKKSLINLMAQKPIKSIAVSELCKEAKITRSTFYNHFYDVYDVYEYVESEFFNEIKLRMDGIKAYAFDISFFEEILSFIYQNKDFAFFIIANMGESMIFKNIIQYVKIKYVEEFLEYYPSLIRKKVETVFTYLINGSIGLLVEWLKEGMRETTDVMAKQIDEFNHVLVKEILTH